MPEKRKYVRMGTVFPVEIQLFDATGEKSSKTLLQGFTRDIGEGGMCLELKSFGKKTEECLNLPDAKLTLAINAVFLRKPVQAFGRIAWLKIENTSPSPTYLVGVAYIQIDEKERRRLYQYAKRLIWIPRVALLIVGLLVALLLSYSVLNSSLSEANKKLVNELIENAEKKSVVLSDVLDLQERKKALEKKLSAASLKISKLERSLARLSAQNINQKDAFQAELDESLLAQNNFKEELKHIKDGQLRLDESAQELKKTGESVSTPGFKNMYEWIKSHQNLRTGLVASFEGDPALADWAFTYDQSLACQTFILFGDMKPAESILSFYADKAVSEDGAFYSAYHAGDGASIENDIKVGPNVWIGIAALQYETQAKDGKYLLLAEKIGDWLIRFQDFEGGLRGGPKNKWYSTEHNLDAYAFFEMMLKVTKNEKYRTAADKTLSWIKKYAYSVKERRLNRGKGDATISTDTFSWAIAALGPKTLHAIQFDVDGIIDFAEKNCETTANFVSANGQKTKAKGFDFAKSENIGRGGIISTEWTAQMIVTYRVLARFYEAGGNPEKAKINQQKADFYLSQLQKLIVTSPSRTGQGRGCLPYASSENVDTGHGWRTPKGKRTGSVAATAYGIFAWKGYNPFELQVESSSETP